MLIASRKRPISVETLRRAAEAVERDLYQLYDDEVPTSFVVKLLWRS